MGIKAGTGVLAALVVGTALGALSRGFMSLVSLVASGSSSFSVTGTSFVLLIYVLVLVPGGVVAALTTHWVRWLLPVAGALFLCVPAIGVASEEIGSTTGFELGQWLGVGAGGVAIFATIALLPVLTVRVADRWLGRRAGAPEGVGAEPAVSGATDR